MLTHRELTLLHSEWPELIRVKGILHLITPSDKITFSHICMNSDITIILADTYDRSVFFFLFMGNCIDQSGSEKWKQTTTTKKRDPILMAQ